MKCFISVFFFIILSSKVLMDAFEGRTIVRVNDDYDGLTDGRFKDGQVCRTVVHIVFCTPLKMV